jgi:two-component system, NtrC family, sensor histidine kinase HydH
MRIATKLTILLLLAASVVLAGFGYLRMQQERHRLVEEVQQEAVVLTNAVRLVVEHAIRDRRAGDIQELLAEIVRYPSPVDRIRIFDTRLEETASTSTDSASPIGIPRADLEGTIGKGTPTVRYVDAPSHPLVYVILPLRNPEGGVIGGLAVVQAATRVERQIREVTQELAVRLSLLSLTIFLVIWLTVRVSIRRPLRTLVRAALALGRGQLTQRITLRRRDEIGQLASAFNRMAEELQVARERTHTEAEGRLDAERQLQQAQKLAALGRLASEVAHEIGTPLSIISGRTEVIQKKLPPDHPLTRHATTVLRQVERISRIIRQLLDYARPRRPALDPLAVEPVFNRVVELLEPLAGRRQVRLVAQVPGALPPVLADADQLQQVLLNLVTNALDATPAGGQVRLTAGDDESGPIPPTAEGRPRISRGRALKPCVTLQVDDTGCGIPPERLEKIFEPFFSTKERAGGTGLGMPIVEDIVRAHGAAIEIESVEGRGTTIWLRWPAATAGTETAGDRDTEKARVVSAPTEDA